MKVVKMSEVVDQTNDTPIVALSGTRIRKLYSEYEDRMGLEPNPDAEPSNDQLSALHMLLEIVIPLQLILAAGLGYDY